MVNDQLIYLDNASTSFPKHRFDIDKFVFSEPQTLNRRGYSSNYNLENLLEETRELFKNFIDCEGKENLVFTLNSTHAINIGLRGCLNKGDHVITSKYEHAAVARTLEALKEEGLITYSTLDKIDDNSTAEEFAIEFTRLKKPNTTMLIMIHGSNVTGNFIFKKEFGQIASSNGVKVFLDASQSIGSTAFSLKEMNVDLMAFSGHKGLLAFTGIGALYFKSSLKMRIHLNGGTGKGSEVNLVYSDKEADYETGTPNIPALYSINQSIKHINYIGIDNYVNHKMNIYKYLEDEISELKEIKIYKNSCNDSLPLLSFNIRGMNPVQETSIVLENAFNIVTRAGLHCSPRAHKTIGTYPFGTVRVSPGYYNSKMDIDYFVNAVKKITKEMGSLNVFR
ncbi:aminotransferase class V-fold PLP-dependent enzyme [Shouchella miscanthi]|uniref:aminotransferase class V-fold PLP-dependent enzyme n=1 Tax=Shouchella miscanthi TaxID=2598861 RepID=UPI0011A42A17|nr:aminotransferase class V-fold PLP-dependent enzyme [Shouchella miscanthi]